MSLHRFNGSDASHSRPPRPAPGHRQLVRGAVPRGPDRGAGEGLAAGPGRLRRPHSRAHRLGQDPGRASSWPSTRPTGPTQAGEDLAAGPGSYTSLRSRRWPSTSSKTWSARWPRSPSARERLGLAVAPITVAVRTGDTTSGARAAMVKDAPDHPGHHAREPLPLPDGRAQPADADRGAHRDRRRDPRPGPRQAGVAPGPQPRTSGARPAGGPAPAGRVVGHPAPDRGDGPAPPGAGATVRVDGEPDAPAWATPAGLLRRATSR